MDRSKLMLWNIRILKTFMTAEARRFAVIRMAAPEIKDITIRKFLDRLVVGEYLEKKRGSEVVYSKTKKFSELIG